VQLGIGFNRSEGFICIVFIGGVFLIVFIEFHINLLIM
jgi:hypothetical protein